MNGAECGFIEGLYKSSILLCFIWFFDQENLQLLATCYALGHLVQAMINYCRSNSLHPHQHYWCGNGKGLLWLQDSIKRRNENSEFEELFFQYWLA